VKVSGLFDDSFAGLEHLEPYGFTSSPAAGAEGLLVQVAGGPSNRLVFLLFNRNARPTGIDPSASAMYDTDGIKVYCLPGGGLSLGAKSATKGVARDQDPVSAGTTMEAWIAKVSTLLNTPGPVIGVAGSVTPPTDFGVISDASRSVKAAD
jgi:phage gp45-like